MKTLTIINKNGQGFVDSREVAEMVEKEHKNLMRDIKGYVEILTSSNLSSLDFFIVSEYQDNKNQTRPCYLLTKKGCDMVANKMTGEKGVIFTAVYVTKFDEMEKKPYAGLSKELQAIIFTDKKIQLVETRVDKLENEMTIDYGQQETLREMVNCAVIDVLGGKGSLAYKRLASKAFAEIWNYYKRKLQVNSYRNTAVVDYEKAKELVEEWEPSSDLQLMIKGANSL
ncbi:MAG: Rha family transcriptional regulator [Clostridiaceae bacterium]